MREDNKPLERSRKHFLYQKEGVVLRPLEKADLEETHQVARAAFTPEVGDLLRGDLEYYLKHHSKKPDGVVGQKRLQYWVLEDINRPESNKILGFCGIYNIPNESAPKKSSPDQPVVFRGGWSGLHPDHQGKGYGELMLSQRLEYAKREGASHYIIETSEHHPKAMGLFTKKGFKRGNSPIPNFWPEGQTMHTLYANITGNTGQSIVKKSKTTWKPLRRNDLSRYAEQIESLAGPRTQELLRSAKYSMTRSSDGATRFFGLFKDGQMHGIADATQHSWIPRETVQTTYFLGRNEEAKEDMLRRLHDYITGTMGGTLHVLQTDAGHLDFFGQHGFKEATQEIPDFYGPGHHGELFVKKL